MAVLKIKDCPFCGGVDCFSFVDSDIKMWSVACSDCGSSCGKYENNEAAILNWNKRPDIKELNFTSTNKQSPPCEHEWATIENPAVFGWDICVKCKLAEVRTAHVR